MFGLTFMLLIVRLPSKGDAEESEDECLCKYRTCYVKLLDQLQFGQKERHDFRQTGTQDWRQDSGAQR